MILFCDTSALVKLYIAEDFSELVKSQLAQAEAIVVCRIAWAEAHAALSRKAREVPADAELIEQAKGALAADWPGFVLMDVNQMPCALMTAFNWLRHLKSLGSRNHRFGLPVLTIAWSRRQRRSACLT